MELQSNINICGMAVDDVSCGFNGHSACLVQSHEYEVNLQVSAKFTGICTILILHIRIMLTQQYVVAYSYL